MSRRAAAWASAAIAGRRAGGARSRGPAPRRRRWSSGRRCRGRRRPASSRDRSRARGAARRRRRRSRSARLPGSIEPISASSPSARAPSRVAIHSTSRAGSDPGPRCTACSVAASRISSNMSSRLLHAAPSAPSDTEMPRARIVDDRRDARAELQVRAGAVQHLDAALGHQRLLGVVDPHAVRGAQMRRGQADLGEVLDVAAGPTARGRAPPRRGSPTRGCGRGCPTPRDSAATRFEQLARARDREARRERRAQPAVRPGRASAGAAPGSRRCPRRQSSCSRAGASPRAIHQALADGGANARLGQRLEHRVGVVHRLHRQHGGGAGAQQLVDGEPRRRAQRVGARAPLRAATPAASATRAAADRRRGRGRASDRDGCGSGRTRAGGSRRAHR